MGSENPFGAPSWLEKELAKQQQEVKHVRPKKVVLLGWDSSPSEITPEMVRDAEEGGLRELWQEYVETVLRDQRCTAKEASRALKQIPDWFRRWAEILIIEGWDLGRVPPKVMQKFNKAIEEVVKEESRGKSNEELQKDLEELEAINKAVSEAQKQAAIKRALEGKEGSY